MLNETICSIIRFELNPFKDNKRGNDYYEPLFRNLKNIEEQFIPNYNISFDVPVFSAKVRYYRQLIDNTITDRLNRLFSDEFSTERVLFYRKKKILEPVQSYLRDIRKIITDNNLDLDVIFAVKDFSHSMHVNENTYIFHYLILALIRYYMEFQQHFIEHIEPNRQLSIDDFFVQTLQWRKSDHVGITRVAAVEMSPAKDAKKSKTLKNGDVVLSFIYTKQRENPEAITDLMNSLKKNGFIAPDTAVSDFRHLFTGKTVNNPIRWTTYFGGLLHLFRHLNENKLIQYEGNNIYKIVCACFVDEDGNRFDETRFRNAKISKIISPKITKAVNLMK